MSTKFEEGDPGRTWRRGFWIVVAPVLVLPGLLVALMVLGLFVPYVDDGRLRARLNDQLNFGDAIAIDRALEKAFLDRWRSDGGRFTLEDVNSAEVNRACVRSELVTNAEHRNSPSRIFAARSDRPWWWSGMPEASTIAMEYRSGTVRAFRLVGSTYPYFGGARLRFAFEAGRASACAKPMDLVFRPRSGDVDVAIFEVGVTGE